VNSDRFERFDILVKISPLKYVELQVVAVALSESTGRVVLEDTSENY
jgi:hypothetical protein